MTALDSLSQLTIQYDWLRMKADPHKVVFAGMFH